MRITPLHCVECEKVGSAEGHGSVSEAPGKHREKSILGRKMGRRQLEWRLLAILVAVCCSCAGFQNPQRILSELGPDETLPPFWHVEGQGGTNLYLLGSIHLGPRGGWQYPEAVEQAFANAHALVVEFNPEELSQEAVAQMIRRYGRLPHGRNLRSTLSPETWDLLKTRLRTSGLRIAAVNRMRPWLLSELLTLEDISRSGYVAEGGVEVAFVARAGQRSIVSLESARFQMASMASLPMETQELALLDVLRQQDQNQKHLLQLVDAWRAGDERSLERYAFQNLAEDEAFTPFFEVMIFQRNRRMRAQLEVLLNAEQHAGENVFVTIGVVHLIGDRGICAELEAAGYRVKRIAHDTLGFPVGDEDSIAAHP